MRYTYKPASLLIYDKLWSYIPGIILLLACLMIASNLLQDAGSKASATTIAPAISTNSDSPTVYTTSSYDGPNVVTNGLGMAASGISRAVTKTSDRVVAATKSTIQAAGKTGRAAGTAITQAGSAAVGGVRTGVVFAGRSFGNGASWIGRGLTNSVVFTARSVSGGVTASIKIPASILGFMADTPVVSAAIKPSGETEIPSIDNSLPRKVAARSRLPVTELAAKTQPYTLEADQSAIWPLRGEITTSFGVPHWPWQPTHTGLDISDGQPSGVTAIKPFKPGRVIAAIRSDNGLGNHVIVDHGGGLTSVYAHMSALSISDGQDVDKTTTLGLEGTTGASTGTHLHFEVRLNGQPVNPLSYLGGGLN